jgi:hypothetical protein
MGNATCDVHGVDEAQALLHAAFADESGDGVGDVHKAAPAGHLEPELFGERFHGGDMPQLSTLRKRVWRHDCYCVHLDSSPER